MAKTTDKVMVYMDKDVHTALKKIQDENELKSISVAMKQVIKESKFAPFWDK